MKIVTVYPFSSDFENIVDVCQYFKVQIVLSGTLVV